MNVQLEKAKIGKELKKEGTLLVKHIEGLSDEDKLALMEHYQANEVQSFKVEGLELKLNREYIKFEVKTVNVMEEKFTPNVIEPSFGIGRIL